MADRTGTLWEHQQLRASLNHGFASHACHILFRDALGVTVDPSARRIRLLLTPLDLAWCEGRLPVGDGAVELRWRRDAGRLVCRLALPAGYELEIDNRTGLEIIYE